MRVRRAGKLPRMTTVSRLKYFRRHALDVVDGEGSHHEPSPWLFSPRNNFGSGGRARLWNLVYEDLATTTVWQPDVYAQAAELAESVGAVQVVDFGCGSGEKLLHFFEGRRRQLFGVDFRGSLRLARNRSSAAVWRECNLALWSDLRGVEGVLATGDPQLLIAADVIEHLSDPRPLVGTIRNMLLRNARSRAVISTPDRHRTRGPGRDGPPLNPCHIREWLLPELGRALISAGLIPTRLAYTRSHLEDDRRMTAFVECRASSASHHDYLAGLDLLGDASREGSLRVLDVPEELERVQQAVFLVPSLKQIDAPVGSRIEDSLRGARAAGFLPHEIGINDRGLASPEPSCPSVAVAVPVRNLRLDWLCNCLRALRNQSIDPQEIVVVDLGSRADYRLALKACLRQEDSGRVRLVRAVGPQVGRPHEVPALGGAGLAEVLAWVPGACVPLTSLLEVSVRALRATPGATTVTTDVVAENGATTQAALGPEIIVRRRGNDPGSAAGRVHVPIACYVRRSDTEPRGAEEPPLGVRRVARLLLVEFLWFLWMLLGRAWGKHSSCSLR